MKATSPQRHWLTVVVLAAAAVVLAVFALVVPRGPPPPAPGRGTPSSVLYSASLTSTFFATSLGSPSGMLTVRMPFA